MDTLSEGGAKAFDNSSIAEQNIQIGSRIRDLEKKSLYFFEASVEADATGGLDVFDSDGAPFALEVIYVIAQCRVAKALGTVKLTDGTDDISNAIVMAVDKTSIMSGTIDNSKSTIAKGGTLKVVTNDADDRGLVTTVAVRR